MITAKIIADSVAQNGKRLTTFELEFPKFLVGEFNTHRAISRNSASSRAIPFSKMVENIMENPAMPVFWGKNQSGMSAVEELDSKIDKPRIQEVSVSGEKIYRNYLSTDIEYARNLWRAARDCAIEFAQKLHDLGVHKQIVNRVIEPWMTTKVIATATDWDNFFFLRNHKDAQPEIAYLAKLMVEEYKNGQPQKLKYGQWHIPYIDMEDMNGETHYFSNGEEISLEDALILSTSLCAQVSYRKSDDSMDKARKIYDKLINSKPCHSSPAEHQGFPAEDYDEISGNFRGWIQYRQTLKDNVCYKYDFGDCL